jgi:hypothetical protein
MSIEGVLETATRSRYRVAVAGGIATVRESRGRESSPLKANTRGLVKTI